ncbi:MAG: hypothetical protein H6R13_1379 [Proteobacteria bacterium]|nr:hypothetical protein [Pseudomonadota bacterium]
MVSALISPRQMELPDGLMIQPLLESKMRNSFKLKALCAALAVTAATAASASQIYLDVGTNFTGANQTGKVNTTSTGVKNEILYTYQSSTTITDLDGNGIDAGDLVSTSIGLFGTNIIDNNYATGFTPGQGFGSASNNGYGSPNWAISFKGENLLGQVAGLNGSGDTAIPLLSYAAGGLIQMLLTFDGTSFNNFMNLLVGGGGATGVGTVLFGIPNFTGVDAGYNNLIHAANGVNCAGATGMQSLVNCVPSPVTVNWVASQDTNVTLSQFVDNGDGTFTVSTNHDGSLRFDIPEPSMLLLMGGALLGLGLTGRRRANRQA